MKKKSGLRELIEGLVRPRRVTAGGGNPNHVPAGSSKGGQFASGKPKWELNSVNYGLKNVDPLQYGEMIIAGQILQNYSLQGSSTVSVDRYAYKGNRVRMLDALGLAQWVTSADLQQYMLANDKQKDWTSRDWGQAIHGRLMYGGRNTAIDPNWKKAYSQARKALPDSVRSRLK